MADKKITQLVDGGAPQATDEFVIARAGDNFKVDYASLESETLNDAVILAPATDARNVVEPTLATVTPLTIRGAAGQSDTLFLVEANGGSDLFKIGPTGEVTVSPPYVLNDTALSIAGLDASTATATDWFYALKVYDRGNPSKWILDLSAEATDVGGTIWTAGTAELYALNDSGVYSNDLVFLDGIPGSFGRVQAGIDSVVSPTTPMYVGKVDGVNAFVVGPTGAVLVNPSTGAVISQIIKAHAAQSVDIFNIQKSNGDRYLVVGATGAVGVGDGGTYNPAAYGGYTTQFVISRASDGAWEPNGGAPFTPASGNGVVNFFPDAEVIPTVNLPSAFHYNIGGSLRYAGDKTSSIVNGAYFEGVFNGTKAAASGAQIAGLIGASGYATIAGTGDITDVYGLRGIAYHGGAGSIGSMSGLYTEASVGVGTGPVTNAYGIYVTKIGGKATVATSYGLYMVAQTGSANNYGIYVAGGKSVFVDTLATGKIALPADADFANGQGAWWWDQANSVPKWKGKTSGGSVVNFTPANDSAVVHNSLYDANTILAATTDDTPAAITMGASTILARLAAGDIKAATPAELRTLLALVVGTDVQAFDADLSAIAALTSAADKMPYSTAAQTWALTTLTSFARTLLDDADASTFLSTLGVSTYIKTLLDDTDATTARATLGALASGANVVGTSEIKTLPSARVYNNADLSINDSTWTKLTFNSERWDTDTMHDTGSNTGRLTATTAGVYVISAHIEFAAGTSGTRAIEIFANNTNEIAMQRLVIGVACDISISTVWSLAAGEYVEARVYQASGGALAVKSWGTTNMYSPEFTMTWLSDQ